MQYIFIKVNSEISKSQISVLYTSILVPNWAPLFRYWTGSCICILFHDSTGLNGHRTDQMLDSPAFTKLYEGERHKPCISILLLVERHSARPSCWWWKKTPCTSILRMFERHHAPHDCTDYGV
jgi:hypothetical protein